MYTGGYFSQNSQIDYLSSYFSVHGLVDKKDKLQIFLPFPTNIVYEEPGKICGKIRRSQGFLAEDVSKDLPEENHKDGQKIFP